MKENTRSRCSLCSAANTSSYRCNTVPPGVCVLSIPLLFPAFRMGLQAATNNYQLPTNYPLKGARVRCGIDFPQCVSCDEGVHLGSGHRGMAEKLLHHPDIRPALQQVRREGMAEGMG